MAAVDNGGPALGFSWDYTLSPDSDPGSAWEFGSDLLGTGSPTPGTNRDFVSDDLGVGWQLGGGTSRGFFQVDAVAISASIPEPSSLALLGAASLFVITLRSRREMA